MSRRLKPGGTDRQWATHRASPPVLVIRIGIPSSAAAAAVKRLDIQRISGKQIRYDTMRVILPPSLVIVKLRLSTANKVQASAWGLSPPKCRLAPTVKVKNEEVN